MVTCTNFQVHCLKQVGRWTDFCYNNIFESIYNGRINTLYDVFNISSGRVFQSWNFNFTLTIFLLYFFFWQVLKEERYRFKIVLRELQLATSVEYKTALIAFVNCIIISTSQLKDRVRIRNEFIGELFFLLLRFFFSFILKLTNKFSEFWVNLKKNKYFLKGKRLLPVQKLYIFTDILEIECIGLRLDREGRIKLCYSLLLLLSLGQIIINVVLP